ncbi:hypothetical protein BKA62DRAFT_832106 [Auriculariales sp. MPI-PUGE-AT-0066]|nr:hypothetical protein BKA62DRAFT_832106 [Auriculariales sp. MPI-PUGE-AT-0066]
MTFPTTSIQFLALLAACSSVLAHVDINFPLVNLRATDGQWNFTDEQQETGAFCGGGVAVPPFKWGIDGAFVSFSGDPGQAINVKLAISNSTNEDFTPDTEGAFNITLVEGVTFGDSGSFCTNITIPGAASFVNGVTGVLYVQWETGFGRNPSSCASTTFFPNLNTAQETVVDDEGRDVVDAEKKPYTFYRYYCSNDTIPARDGSEHEHEHEHNEGETNVGEACNCHCHGDHSHCSGTCSDANKTSADKQCAAGIDPTVGAASATTSPTATPTGSANSRWLMSPSFGYAMLLLAGASVHPL